MRTLTVAAAVPAGLSSAPRLPDVAAVGAAAVSRKQCDTRSRHTALKSAHDDRYRGMGSTFHSAF